MASSGATVKDVSTSLDMTKTIVVAAVIGLLKFSMFAQESPAPSASSNATAAPSESPTASPSPTSTPVARHVRISFVPPPMDGTISLGIFDSNKKLVRILDREAKTDNFTIDESSLTTFWDGKNDAGEDLPAGKYHARGYLVGDLKLAEISPAPTAEPPQSSDHVAIKMMINPLLSDVRSVMDLAIGFDTNGSFLRTMDNLPLFTVSKTPNVSQAVIAKETEKTATVWQTAAATPQQFRISNLDKMMAFDCGDFQLR